MKKLSLTYSDMTISVVCSLFPSLVVCFNFWNNFLLLLLMILQWSPKMKAIMEISIEWEIMLIFKGMRKEVYYIHPKANYKIKQQILKHILSDYFEGFSNLNIIRYFPVSICMSMVHRFYTSTPAVSGNNCLLQNSF